MPKSTRVEQEEKMDWHHLMLESEATTEAVKERFLTSFRNAGGPRAMALFRRNAEGGKIDLYFTPDCAVHAAALLEELQAEPCAGPALAGLELLVGHNEITYYLTT